MAIVQSLGKVESLTPPWYQGINRRAVRLYDRRNYEYAVLYRLQPNIRTCVDFLSRNVAQLGLHQYERISDDNRVKLDESYGLTRLIKTPLPPKYKTTRYRMIEAYMGDMGTYFNAYLLKIRDENGKPVGLLRIPPQYVEPKGGLVITHYELKLGGAPIEIDSNDIVHSRGYNPENPTSGLSPMETLRRILAEEDSAGKYREDFWRHGAKIEGLIERPADAPEWSKPALQRFKQEFQDLYAPEGSGARTAILEDGMKWIAASFNPKEAEYLGGRKLTREECARAYHIPLPMVGILDHATMTNVKEQHKQLYQDSIGPWLSMLEEDFDLQLVPEFVGEGFENVYNEFNILEKLQGDFGEMVASLQSSIGRPYMTPNEGRARLNMPSLDGDADELATPLNVIVGGLANPRDTAQKLLQKSKRAAIVSKSDDLENGFLEKWVQILTRYYNRQARSIQSQIPASIQDEKSDLGGGVWWDKDRWDRELKEDLLRLNLVTALAYAEFVFMQTNVEINDPQAFEDRMMPYLDNHSRIQAEKINETTRLQLTKAVNDQNPLESVKDVFAAAVGFRVIQQAITAIASIASFGSHEGARASGLSKKTWIVNSNNPRDSHAAMNGETVGIRELFSNGLRWPGDSSANDADEVANCQCSMEYS